MTETTPSSKTRAHPSNRAPASRQRRAQGGIQVQPQPCARICAAGAVPAHRGPQRRHAIDSFTRDLAGFHKADAAHYNAVLHGCINTADDLDALITPLLDRKLAEISPIEHASMWIGVYEFSTAWTCPGAWCSTNASSWPRSLAAPTATSTSMPCSTAWRPACVREVAADKAWQARPRSRSRRRRRGQPFPTAPICRWVLPGQPEAAPPAQSFSFEPCPQPRGPQDSRA
jgi:transcription termination factor NusB